MRGGRGGFENVKRFDDKPWPMPRGIFFPLAHKIPNMPVPASCAMGAFVGRDLLTWPLFITMDSFQAITPKFGKRMCVFAFFSVIASHFAEERVAGDQFEIRIPFDRIKMKRYGENPMDEF